jgi:LuxR family transcriptional regulator, maltose regulon positive regulatory protein
VSGGIVPRPGLFERLTRTARVAEVSALAGSGKTVLLRSWIAEGGLGRSAGWVSVGPGERDPQRFWLSVFDALRDTEAGSALVRQLTAAPDLDPWLALGTSDLAELDSMTSSDDVQLPKLVRSHE